MSESGDNMKPVLSVSDYFQIPCPNCGAKDGRISLQVRYLERMKSKNGNEIVFDGFGVKAKIGFGNYNPDARFLRKKQSPISSFIEKFFAYLVFVAAAFGILFCSVYLIAVVVVYAKTGNILPLKIFLSIPGAVVCLILASRHSNMVNKNESEYWLAYESMAEVATCSCGKIISPLPKIIAE